MAISFSLGTVRLKRVAYFDVPLDSGVVGLTTDEVLAVPWGVPAWATPAGKVLIGQAVWVIEAGEPVLVVDPCGAADAFLRTLPDGLQHQRAVVNALASAGFDVDQVDTVIMSHLDGIGMAAALDDEGRWKPLFPNARVALNERELERVRAHPEIEGPAALNALSDWGVVAGMGDRWEPAPDVTVERSGGHTSGHAIIRIAQGAVFLGHLAVTPLNVAAGVGPGGHDEPSVARTALEWELRGAAVRGSLVIGPLWPEPGAGRVTGPPWKITPALDSDQ
jgi:glyoxylase-like metal-dependent hydrolase (beta-lactamase superfamily II)